MPEELSPAIFWQERELRFDITAAEYALRPGEFIIDTLDGVEDTKGNNGEKGMLCVTNVRLLWHCEREPKVNLSIGYDCFAKMEIKETKSRIKGLTQGMFITCIYNDNNFFFTFTYLVHESPRLFTTVSAVWKAHASSKVYRELRLRTAIIQDDELVLLPNEQINNKVSGIWNLSTDSGTLGSLYITSVRIVWFAHLAENFNVSIPHVQITNVKCRDTRFGAAFVIETSPYAGNFILGFRADPPERVIELYKEVSALWRLHSASPDLGVTFELEQAPSTLDENTIKRVVDGLDVVQEVATDAFAAYFADDGMKTGDRKPVYDATLGLAVEKPRNNTSLATLWAVPV